MNDIFERYDNLEICRDDMERGVRMMCETYYKGGKILVCGNGGSCADSEHIVGELMKSFVLPRNIPQSDAERLENLLGDDAELFKNNLQRGIPAFSLCSQSGVMTAYNNDVNADLVYAQLLYASAKKEDLLIGISTSGNSANIVNAISVAKAVGTKTVAMTGEKESKLMDLCDVTINVPACETYKVQEYHLPVYHYLCAAVEKHFFSE